MSDQYGGLLSPFLRRKRLAVATPHLRGRVLDVGCHDGALAEAIPAERYLGIDVDRDSVARAQAAHPRHRFCHVSELGADERFDTIAALAVIEHVDEPTVWLKDLGGRLNDGGRFVITTPHARWEWIHGALSKLRITSHEASEEHETIFDQNSLRELFASAGYRIERYQRFLLRMNQLAVASRADAG